MAQVYNEMYLYIAQKKQEWQNSDDLWKKGSPWFRKQKKNRKFSVVAIAKKSNQAKHTTCPEKKSSQKKCYLHGNPAYFLGKEGIHTKFKYFSKHKTHTGAVSYVVEGLTASTRRKDRRSHWVLSAAPTPPQKKKEKKTIAWTSLTTFNKQRKRIEIHFHNIVYPRKKMKVLQDLPRWECVPTLTKEGNGFNAISAERKGFSTTKIIALALLFTLNE